MVRCSFKCFESGFRIAEYLTEIPPRELLEQKLNAAVAIARERLAAREQSP
jgi:hypothetical protein